MGWQDLVGMAGILIGIRGLVLEDLDEFVEAGRYDRSEHGAEPVNPVVRLEDLGDDTRTEAAGWVQRCTGEVPA